MVRSLAYFVLTLLAAYFSPSSIRNEGFKAFLIASLPFFLVAANQKKLFKRPHLDFLVLSELFLFTLLFFYWIGISHTLFHLCTFLLFYFIAVGIGISWNLSLFLLPFALPFLLFFAASRWLTPLIGEELFILVSSLLLLLLILLMPIAFQRLWRCQPLPQSPLKDRLDFLCRRQGFHHGGMLIWSVMRNKTNAAIIGIFPRFRYILFTNTLLHAFPEEEVEAVLAHEMGHAVHKHSLLYPFILLGLPTLVFLLSSTLNTLHPLIAYFTYTLIFILYIRFVLGFFSRNFEKQADLHVFAVGIGGETLSTALKRISHLNSLPLKKRNWHHGSLANRIALLQKAESDPGIIQKHHRKIRYYLTIYVLINLSFWTCWILKN